MICESLTCSSDANFVPLVCARSEQHMEQLISLILKVAKEQAYCFPGNKVMIFTVENEGKQRSKASCETTALQPN